MAKKQLQNMKVIKQLLAGESKYHSKRVFAVGGEARGRALSHKYKVGECWHDQDLVTEQWTTYFKHAGYVSSASGKWKTYDEYQDYRGDVWGNQIDSLYQNCFDDNEECTKGYSKKSKVEDRLVRRTGMCMSCLSKHELKLQIAGKFDEYAMDKMRANLKSWVRDQEIELTKWKKSLREKASYLLNGDGETESWSDGDPEIVIAKLDKEFTEFKTDLYNNYGIDEDED